MNQLFKMNNLIELTHLERLQYEDALEEGEAQRHDPLDGLFFAVLKAIQQGEVSGDSTDGQQQEPGQEHKPPGQPAARRPALPLPHRRWAGDKEKEEMRRNHTQCSS